MDFKGYNTQQIFEALKMPELTTKKNILDAISTIKKLSKTDLDEQQLKDCYQYVDQAIDAMSQSVKVNTLAYLKNELNHQLGKYIGSSRKEDNAFLKFYKQTFKNQIKTKEYTWAMLDLSKIQDSSVLETLKTINTYALRQRLTAEEKEDIFPMIKRIADTQNLRLINQVRSMEGIRKAFRIKIVEKDNRFCIVKF